MDLKGRFLGTALLLLLSLSLSCGQEVEDEDVIVMQDTTVVSYVMEPFEAIDDEWIFPKNLNLTLSDDALFGSHALRVEILAETDYDSGADADQPLDVEFGWILPDRPHNCYGAEQFSMWIKTLSSATATIRVTMLDDRACEISNRISQIPNLCTDPLRLDSHVVMEHQLEEETDNWQQLRVSISELEDKGLGPNLDLRRLRGWIIQVQNATGPVLIDQLSCVGGGSMLGSAFHTGIASFQEAVEESTWMESYYQSEMSRNFSNPLLQDGRLNLDYMVEQVESWGGFTDYAHLAPGAAYYNLSQATSLVLEYNVTEPASIPGRAIMRLVLQDNSHCEEDCDTDYHAHERWYTFLSILDEPNSGKIVVPLEGTVEPTSPFWLAGWSGITGNQHLDTHQIKGFTLELVLDSVLQLGAVVTGSLSLFHMSAALISDVASAPMSYVMEPFETIDQEWSWEPKNDLSKLNITISDDAMFGDHSLRVDYDAENFTTAAFRWILRSRPHNCFGADHMSLWYKSLDPRAHIRLTMFDDSSCIASNQERLPGACTDPDNLNPVVLLDQGLAQTGDWEEIKMSDFGGLDLRRLRGWQIELVDSGIILLDQLACLGGGAMIGSSFFIGSDTFQDAIAENTWMESYYQSITSQNNSFLTLEGGQLSVEYAVEQVETWGGFMDFAHLAPGAAYYNLSQATDLLISYNVLKESSVPGRAIFRLVLQDNSHCEANCDGDYHAHERWYSFHSILDDAGSGQIVVPLEGSVEPSSSWWLTGWSGITGNSQLDVTNLKGFTLEIVLDSVLPMSNLVSGAITFSGMTAGISHQEPQEATMGLCVPEQDLYFFEYAPQFTRIEFLGAQCCDTCAKDPECLYAFSSGRDCYVANYVDPNYVGLLNNEIRQTAFTSFWMNDRAKRGDWCDRCSCREDDLTVDCKGRDLAILPKTYNESWNPKRLDLRENPRLVLLGTGSLSEISESVEEIWLPLSMKHIALQSLEPLSRLKSVGFEGDQNVDHNLVNTITEPSKFFADVCCGLGSRIDLDMPGTGLTFCNMQISAPGVDAAYEPFISYKDATPLQVLTPSASFMSEAAETVEKCAEYCSIENECRFFSYDARLPNAEHACHLLANNGTRSEYVCCDEDHYADEAGIMPGWISGRPPQTRHELDDANVLLSPKYHNVNKLNGFQTEYQVSLGSTPLRGGVWVEPTLLSTSGLDVTVSPSRVVLYDVNQTATVSIHVHNVNSDSPSATLVVQNSINSCDEAYMVTSGPNENMVYIIVTAPEVPEDGNLALAIGLPIALAAVLALSILLFYEQKRKQNDSVWIVKKEELEFAEPPEIIGRGTFGLVLLGEYRGTQVAVKRVIPARGKKGKAGMGSGSGTGSGTGMDSGSDGSDTNSGLNNVGTNSSSGSNNIGMMSGSSYVGTVSESNNVRKKTSSGYNAGNTSWGNMSFGLGGKSGFSSALSSILGVGSSTITRSDNRSRDRATWRKMRSEFLEEMRYLSKLRHPCVTTVMGAVIGNNIEPMLIMEYMDHGSLYDLLHNETMVIEGELLLPVLRDISQGVRFLHSATPQVLHGDLKAQNILVDSKFRAKVADFGLSQKKNMGGTGTPFWMAPELLRGESSNTAATDVYSFGIILYEVYSRRNPYESEDPVEVLRLVADKLVRKRPPIPKHCPPQVQSLMVDCLVDEADMRPSFEELDIRLKRVEVKDVDADKSSKKAASISLFDIFPRHIAEALRDGRTVEPEHRDVVTIFFSDIIGFTDISSDLPPRKVADMLDRLYTKLDALSGKYDVFKVETIGDAYMAVTNLVKDQPLDHVKRIANFAIDAVKAANGTYIDLEDHNKGFVSMRVGFHSGSVVADVVGTRNPRYCLFGDTVNTASRMESYSKANRIHCSSAAADILMEECPELPLKSRGLIYIKGKGEMHTFWVNEEGKGRQSITQELTDAEKSMLNWVGSKEPKMEMLKEESLPERSSELIPEDHAADSHDIEAATRASQ